MDLFDKHDERPAARPMRVDTSKSWPKAESRKLTDQERKHYETMTQRVIAFLMEHDRWVSTAELMEKSIGGHRFSSCVHTLRQRGYMIDKRPVPGTITFEYRFRRKVDMVSTKNGWQDAYYESEHWKRVREDRKKHDGYRCCNCHSGNDLEVHHLKYVLFDENLLELMTLCTSCHAFVHENARLCFPKSVPLEIYERLMPHVGMTKTTDRSMTERTVGSGCSHDGDGRSVTTRRT